MPTRPSPPPKPLSTLHRHDLTRLPRLSRGRLVFRRLLRGICRGVIFSLTRPRVSGLEYFPPSGPALVVSNHLGDADLVLVTACLPAIGEVVAKVELVELPLIGALMDAYGVIWVHRGQPDVRAIRAALEALSQGRLVGVAPEGRESVTGALEEATNGAAFLALKAGVPVIPVTLSGTENKRLITNLKHLRRTPVTLTIGPAFSLPGGGDRREALKRGTRLIMETLARQLPEELRGAYSYIQE